jgi:hypothetical protein
MAREMPESEVATMEALVKCRVVMVSIALVYAMRLGAIQRFAITAQDVAVAAEISLRLL